MLRALSHSLLLGSVACHSLVRPLPVQAANLRQTKADRSTTTVEPTVAQKPAQQPAAQSSTSTAARQSWANQPFAPPGALLSIGAVDPQGRWVQFCEADSDSQAALETQLGKQSSFLGDRFK